MSTQSPSRTTQASARRSTLPRDTAMSLAAAEYVRVADQLEALSPEQWASPTECPGWDVRAMAGHILGMVQMVASLSELVRQQVSATRRAKRDGGLMIDALTALQVEQNAGLAPADLVGELRRLGPRAVRNRTRVPAPLRAAAMDDEVDGRWTFGYLLDVILTRDPFMHRIDISRATGAAMAAAAEHEGVIVDDVVREWMSRHGEPVSLHLEGPAGGRWQQGGAEPERIEMDAFEFCRALSGRTPAAGLLATQVPF